LNPDIFAEWLKRQGHTIYRTQSSYWYNQAPRTFQAFPYHWLIEPGEGELIDFLKIYRGVALRYSTVLSAKSGMISYHVVYSESSYPIDELPKKARHDVQHGLQKATIEPISFERLAVEGWQLRYDTLVRQKRTKAETHSNWENMCRSAIDLPGFETWGAIVDGKLAAAMLVFTIDNCSSILYQQSATEYLRYGVNNALTFAITNEIINRGNGRWLFYGLNSLDAPASVDEFKFRMGFTAKPVRQRVVFNPWIAPVINPITSLGLNAINNILPGHPTFSKANGVLRFYLDGKHSLVAQNWPESLLDQKESILQEYEFKTRD
jgi:hypothetical protein